MLIDSAFVTDALLLDGTPGGAMMMALLQETEKRRPNATGVGQAAAAPAPAQAPRPVTAPETAPSWTSKATGRCPRPLPLPVLLLAFGLSSLLDAAGTVADCTRSALRRLFPRR